MTRFPWKLYHEGNEIIFPEGSRRFVKVSVRPIDSDGGVARLYDGSAVFMGSEAFRIHNIELTCTDQTPAPLFQTWPGQKMTLESPEEFAVPGPIATLSHTPVSGSVYGVDASDTVVGTRSSQAKNVNIPGAVVIRYRPILECMVVDRSGDGTQRGTSRGWSLSLTERIGNEAEDADGDYIRISSFDLVEVGESGNISVNVAANMTTNTGLSVAYSLLDPVPVGAQISGTGLLTWNNVPDGGWTVKVRATSGTVSAEQGITVYRAVEAIPADLPPLLTNTLSGEYQDESGKLWRDYIISFSSSVNVVRPGRAKIFMIAGGGSGGACSSATSVGAGGAGGAHEFEIYLEVGTINCLIGSGSPGATIPGPGVKGNNTVITVNGVSYTTIGGGRGGVVNTGAEGGPGGCGGGSGSTATAIGPVGRAERTPSTLSRGGDGGAGFSSSVAAQRTSGGGGGLLEDGQSGTSVSGGRGGNGIQKRYGFYTSFGGGGGGATLGTGSQTGGAGGIGAGGNGGKQSAGGNGGQNRGAGGGAGSDGFNGGNGGSGIIVIRTEVS